MADFKLPPLSDSTSGWGPVDLSSQFRDIPYAPYAKADKLGRIADWSAPEGTQGKDGRGTSGDQRGGRSNFRNFRGIHSFNHCAFHFYHTLPHAKQQHLYLNGPPLTKSTLSSMIDYR